MVLDRTGSGGEVVRCEHLIFIFIDGVGEFEYIRPNFESIIRREDESDVWWAEGYEKRIDDAIGSQSWLEINIGIEWNDLNGPHSELVKFGFNYLIS